MYLHHNFLTFEHHFNATRMLTLRFEINAYMNLQQHSRRTPLHRPLLPTAILHAGGLQNIKVSGVLARMLCS